MKLTNKQYDTIKFVTQLLLPALATLYFALAGIWNWPYGEEIVGTITAIDAFLTEYKASVEYTETNLEDTAALCETYGIIPKAAVAKQAIPRCSITCVTGADMQKIATENFNVLLAANPKAIGGKLPADDFWYGI